MKHSTQHHAHIQAEPPLAWLLVSAIGGALAAIVVAGVVAGRAGVPISGALLLGAALLGGLPQLLELARGRWRARVPELAAALVALLAVGGVGIALAWPALLPIGPSVDAVHHYQLVRWIAENGAFPPVDGQTSALMGEMIAYPPGLALVVVAAAALSGLAPLDVLYPTVALLGGLNAALVVLLAGAGELRMKHEELRSAGRRRFLHSTFYILRFLGLLVGPLLLLAHRAYTLEAYTDQSYYAMVLGVLLVLLAAGHLIVAPRLTPLGAAQLGLALVALVGVYPLWLAIPAVFAAAAIALGPAPATFAFARRARRAQTRLSFPLDGAGASWLGRRVRLPGAPVLALAPHALALAALPAEAADADWSAAQPIGPGRPWLRKLLLGALALLPPLGMALADLPGRLRVGRIVLAHEGFVTLPTPENLVPVLLALPCVLLACAVFVAEGALAWRQASRQRLSAACRRLFTPQGHAFDGGRRLVGLALVALAMLLALFAAARFGRAASYHVYKLLFVLTPVAAAVVSAAVLRLAAIGRPLARWLALAGVGGLLAATGSFQVAPRPAFQALTPDLIEATRWLATSSPRDAKRAIVIGAPAGPQAYWVQVGLLNQRRDKATLAMRGFDTPAPSPEGWVVDDSLPKVVVAAQLDRLPPSAQVVARFGAAAVLRRAPKFDAAALDPLLIRYHASLEDQRLKTEIELQRRLPGRMPLLELRLDGPGGPIAAYPLQPDAARTRPQFLGLELLPATLGGSGYINRDAYPAFDPPAVAPSGPLTLTLRLMLEGHALDERTLATFWRLPDGRVEQLKAGGGELVYLRQAEDSPAPRYGGARVTDDLLLTGWTPPARTPADSSLAVGLRWQALRPIDRSLFAEIQVVDAGGQVVAASLSAPQDGFHPTWRWRVGEDVLDQRAIALPPGLAPGVYRLQVSVRDFSGQPGASSAGAAPIGEFVVE